MQRITEEGETHREPDSGKSSKPPLGSMHRVKRSFHIPIPVHTMSNLSN